MPNQYAMQPPGGAPMGPDMGMVPPGPGMDPAGMMPPDMGQVPPGPDQMLGSSAELPPVTVPGWVPADPSIPVDEATCAEINAIPYKDKDGNQFCLVPPPGGPLGGLPSAGPLGP